MGVFLKQLLYLTNDQLTAYQWEKDSLSLGHIFSNDEDGWEDFSLYLAGSHNTMTFLLADLVEEDFQRDTLPHVLGRSRQALVQRRLSQLYRDTPYRQAIRQGREESGRRDDRMLFSALTNMGLLKPWLDNILKQKVPLTGIYSPALLTSTLIKKLDLTSNNLLLVTHHSCGVRQSFFQGSALKFSRLTPLANHHPNTVSETIGHETASIQQFLTSTRLLSYSETLDVVILAHEEVIQRLQPVSHDTPVLAYRFFDLVDAANLLGVEKPDSVTLCDSLFLSLLGHSIPASHYAQKEQTRYFRLQQIRIFLYILSAGIFAGTLLWIGLACMSAVDNFRQSRQMALETEINQAQYQTLLRALPPTVATPQNMKVAVNLERMISSNAAAPSQLLSIVSHALDALPQIRVDQLHWQVSTEAESAESPQSQPAPAPQLGPDGKEPAPSSAVVGIPKKPNQVLLIEGEVTPFENDYRTALASVHLFAAKLGKNKQLKAEITQPPLDIRPTERLTGRAGNEDPESKARFSLKLTLKPES